MGERGKKRHGSNILECKGKNKQKKPRTGIFDRKLRKRHECSRIGIFEKRGWGRVRKWYDQSF